MRSALPPAAVGIIISTALLGFQYCAITAPEGMVSTAVVTISVHANFIRQNISQGIMKLSSSVEKMGNASLGQI